MLTVLQEPFGMVLSITLVQMQHKIVPFLKLRLLAEFSVLLLQMETGNTQQMMEHYSIKRSPVIFWQRFSFHLQILRTGMFWG